MKIPAALAADVLQNLAVVADTQRRLASWIRSYPGNGEFPILAARSIARDLDGLAALLEQTHSALAWRPPAGSATEN